MKNKKADSGIGVGGVVIAIIIVLFIRGCIREDIQTDINNFCKSNNYEYGIDTVKNTLIECSNISITNSTKYSYSEFEQYKAEKEARDKALRKENES